ncbi:alpha/beta hydrolase [Rhodococcus sp. ACS1]|uniref:alpha/beta hydrolase n=1 Tax=Rhodococcus sp. ACS1 TaxID=2028570 RepID=UPI001C527C9E|nr:alpha/beta hydrolase [Rhodococcus sp. ACS1]
MSTTTELVVDAEELQLSGRIAGPRTVTRGLIIALHGGTYDSCYYDMGPDSLLGLGALLGYTVVALDRPGYGATAGIDPTLLSFAAQTRILSAAVDSIATKVAPTTQAVIVGHSIGGMLALCVASNTTDLVHGVEISGLGEVWQPGLREMWESMIDNAPTLSLPADSHAQVMFGPAGTFSAEQVTQNSNLLRPLPMPELIDVVGWSDLVPAVARTIKMPVSLTFAEHDNIWRSDVQARETMRARFTSTPDIRVDLQAGVGHSIELHHRARAYCLRRLAFVEECLTP